MRIVLLAVSLALPLASVAATPPAQAADAPPRAIRRSDVVFMYDNPKMLEPYGCTVMG